MAHQIFAFSVICVVLTRVGFQFHGRFDIAFRDSPILIWITLVVNISPILVIYFWIHIPARRPGVDTGGDWT